MCGGVVGYFCLNFLHKVEGKYTKGGKLALCKCYDLMGMSKPTCMYACAVQKSLPVTFGESLTDKNRCCKYLVIELLFHQHNVYFTDEHTVY